MSRRRRAALAAGAVTAALLAAGAEWGLVTTFGDHGSDACDAARAEAGEEVVGAGPDSSKAFASTVECSEG